MTCLTFLQHFVLLFTIAFTVFSAYGNPTCPCWTSSSPNISDPEVFREVVEKKQVICIAENVAANRLFVSIQTHELNLNLRMVKDDSNITSDFVKNNTVQQNSLFGCDFLLKITDDDSLVVAEDGF